MSMDITLHLPPTPSQAYTIHIGSGLTNTPQKWLPPTIKFNHIVIVTDHTVKKHYLAPLVNILTQINYPPLVVSFPAGEKYKNQTTKQTLEEKILSKQLGRDTLCIALGGGVVGDMTGFIAATYMRGIPYIQIPTTLLAMVDSSVGGKTAIDTPQGKNLIGAFWQPAAVVADVDYLNTLPQTHIISGLVEALKMFLTNDAPSFYDLQKNLPLILEKNNSALQKLIYQAIHIKASVVAADEKENNLRMVLNFGHTIGHALEKITEYRLLHGYAVAYGILLECAIARQTGLLNEEDYQQIERLLNQLGFYTDYFKKFNISEIIRATRTDKKASAKGVRYVLLQNIGTVYTENSAVAHVVDDQTIKAAFKTLCS